MDVLSAIFTRRSIRKYKGGLIKDEDLKTIIRAGCYAPSAHNYQPWNFVVVNDKAKLEEIAAGHPYAKMLPQAGCGIVVCGDSEKQKLEGFLAEDCAAAIQNMLLAAHDLGLGTVWCGIHPVPELVKLFSDVLGLPSNIKPIGLVVVGSPEENRNVSERFDEAKVHYNKW